MKNLVQKLGYAAGDFGCNFIFATLATWFIPFCVSKGLSIYEAGLIIFISKFIDALVDFFLGYIIDKRQYRIKKFMLVGAPLVILSLLALQLSSDFLSLFVSFTLLNSISYNIVNIPYSTLNLRMTDDPNEKVSLNCWRMFGSISCMILVNTVTPIIGNMHIVNGILFLVFTYFCALTCKENYTPQARSDMVIKEVVCAVGSSLSFWIASVIFFIINCKLTLTFIDFGLHGETAGINTLLFMGPSLIMMFILPSIYKRISKKLILACAFMASTLIAVLDLTQYKSCILIDGFAFSIMASLLYNLYADVSEHIEYRNGLQIQAFLFAMASILTNLASGITALTAEYISTASICILSIGTIASFMNYMHSLNKN